MDAELMLVYFKIDIGSTYFSFFIISVFLVHA